MRISDELIRCSRCDAVLSVSESEPTTAGYHICHTCLYGDEYYVPYNRLKVAGRVRKELKYHYLENN